VTEGEAFFQAREVVNDTTIVIDYQGLDEEGVQWGEVEYLGLNLETDDEVMLALQDFVIDVMDMIASDLAKFEETA
jgi:hypothetical protein